MSTVPYADYLVATKTQAGAGTANILAALTAGYHYEIVFVAWEVVVVNAGGSFKVQSSDGPVELFDGSCIALGNQSMPIGKFVCSVATETLDLVVATGGTVVAHVTYRKKKIAA